jgi:Fe-S cluster assembly protein SufD
VALEGAGAGVDISGVSVLSGSAHADVTTHVTHAVCQTQSVQLFKKVVGGGAQAIYQGKVTVKPDADGSDSRQTAKALLLGPKAEADLKPELEILADDVKCAHGAAVGDLDADSLFYLKSRGIPEKDARHLLLHAFLEDAVESVANTDLREMVRGAVANALDQVTA